MSSLRPILKTSFHFIFLRSYSIKVIQKPTLPFSKERIVHYAYTEARGYSKSKDKKKSDKGKSQKVELNEELMSRVIDVLKLKSDCENIVNKMKEDFVKNVSLRSSTGSIENLKVHFEGKNHGLLELAQINRKNPKTVALNMSAFPQAIPSVLKALSSSGMNLSPQQDGTSIYVPIPRITREHRESLAKNAKGLFQNCKDNIKKVQNKYIKAVKDKEGSGISKDDGFNIVRQVTFIAETYISEADKTYENKKIELVGED